MTLRATGRETEAVAYEDLASQSVPAFTVCGNVISPFPDQACALYMAQKLEAVFARIDRMEDLLAQRPEELHAVCRNTFMNVFTTHYRTMRPGITQQAARALQRRLDFIFEKYVLEEPLALVHPVTGLQNRVQFNRVTQEEMSKTQFMAGQVAGVKAAAGTAATWVRDQLGEGEFRPGGAWMGKWLQSGTTNAAAFQQVFAELKDSVEGAGGARAVHGTILASTPAMMGAPLADGAQPTKRIASAIQRAVGKALAVQLLHLTATQPDIPESVAARNVDKESAMLLTVNPTADTVLEARDFRARAQTLMGKELGEYRPLVGAAMGDHRGTRVDALGFAALCVNPPQTGCTWETVHDAVNAQLRRAMQDNAGRQTYMNEEVARQYFYSCVPVQEHGAPLEQPQHQNHSSGMPASETPAISRRNFTPGQERPGRGQYVIEPDGRFIDMAAIQDHVDRRSILATRREVIVELKITYANHYYAHQGRGVERRVTRVPPQYLDHARRNDEHYYGAGGRTPFQDTLRRTGVMAIAFGRYGEWSDSAREFVAVAAAAGAVNIYSRMRHSISWWDKGAKGRIMNAIKATMSRDLHGRLAKLQRARVETVTRPADWARQVVANRL